MKETIDYKLSHKYHLIVNLKQFIKFKNKKKMIK